MVTAKSTRNPGRKPAGTASADDPLIQAQLRFVAVELYCALSAVTLAARALREQNADIDSDAATVLQRGAGAPIHACLERIEALLGGRSMDDAGPGGPRPVH